MARDLRERLLPIMRGEIHTASGRLLAGGLRLLSGLYNAALHAHLAGYRVGLARRTRLDTFVISVGNLTVGGTGKTTACLALAECFLNQGKKVAYLSRGYRGQGERETLVVSKGAGPVVTPMAAGDEPYLVAQTFPQLVVLVGKDRRRTGRLAVAEFGADVILLDDGFQYQRLARDLDIVLVDALVPFGYDGLVPRGLLREPVAHLARAHAIWLTHCDLVRRTDLAEIHARLQQVAPQARVWETRHASVAIREVLGGVLLDPEVLEGKRVLAISGLGNPLAFERALHKLGVELIAHAQFPDHHHYHADEIRRVVQERGAAAEWIVTTAKDAVRLPREALSKPTWVLEIVLAGLPSAPSLSEELSCLSTATNES